ncbi:hypothetical protein BDV29DRAFT_169535, partial [Aspergillus leporis]
MARHSKAKARIKRQKPTMKISTAHQSDHLTMQQEARNTEGRNLWRPGFHLRHQTVRFVSAGNLQPEGNESETEENDKQPPKSTIDSKESVSSSENQSPEDHASFFIDLLGEPAAHTGLSDPTTTLSLSERDDSSEDEIVFHGRRKHESRPLVIVETGHFTKAGESIDHLPDEFELSLKSTPPVPNSNVCSNSSGTSATRPPHRVPSTKDNISDPRAREIDTEKAIWEASASEDDTLADYIANMAEHYHGDAQSLLTDTELNEPEHAIESPSQSSPIHAATPVPNSHTEKGKTSLREDPPKYDEREINIIDMNIFPRDNVTLARDHDLDSLQCSSSDEGDVYNSDLDLEGLESLQSELQEQSTRSRWNHKESKGGFFASATAFAHSLEADPYHGFDIMDFSRPSLRKKQKGKLRSLDLVLSDSEFGLELENAWRDDREKKKVRKQKREELRSQGLLGRGAHGPDLKSKYSNGIGFGDLKTEICTFLLSSTTSLALPPMTKQHRKSVHDLANALSLNSQSRGKGSSRFPILHKTSRTPRHTQKTITSIDKILSRGRFHHAATKSWDRHVTKSARPRRGRPDSSVSYMEGDIVGGSAPEIGAENKGRAMLEKMGWSTGTALGAINNKGILLPVAHVVKNSKAGL